MDAAPTALIDAGLLTQLSTDLGYDVHHDNQVHTFSSLIPQSDAPYRNMKNPRAVSAVTKALASEVYSHAAAGRLVLTLGGDHSIAIGTIAGTSRAIKERLSREVAVIWVDAHADINTPETSASGNIHGMPVAFLTGLAKEDEDDVFGWLGKEGGRAAEEGGGVLSLKKLVYIGLRDVDRGEKEILRKHGVKAFSMHDIDRYFSSDHALFQPLHMRLSTIELGHFAHIQSTQARYRSRNGARPRSHRFRHPHPSFLRRRRARSAMGSEYRHACSWRPYTPRRRLHRRVCS